MLWLAVPVMQPLDLTVLEVRYESTFAGRLGMRVRETIVARTLAGSTVEIRLPRAHSRFGPTAPTARPGDTIRIPRGFVERNTLRVVGS